MPCCRKMGLVPIGRFLIGGKGSVEGGVCIPKIEKRMHELPRPEVEIRVVGYEASPLVSLLRNRERLAVRVGWIKVEPGVDERPRWRLWRPNPWIERQIREMTPGRVLDLGCGCGREAVAFACAGWRVTAVDHLPDAIERARDLEERYGDPTWPITWIAGDALACEGEFDVVTAVRYFHPGLIDRIPNVLRVGGLALIETFTEERREKTGKPASMDLILTVEQARTWPGMRLLGYEKTPEVRRYTLQRV